MLKSTSLGKLGLAAIASFAVVTAPMSAHAHDRHISINGIDFGDDDLLEQLIELDDRDIDEIREEMADARDEIADAIVEIREAREEAKAAPGGAVIMKVALGTASVVVTRTTKKAFGKIRADLNDASKELETVKSDVGSEEYAETKRAIRVIRSELSQLEKSLEKLTAAMRS